MSEVTNGGRRPAMLMVAGLLAIVIVAALAGVLVYRWYDQQPPSLDEGPDVVRLTGSPGPGIPPPRTAVSFPDGSKALVSLAYADRADGRLSAHLAVVSQGASTASFIDIPEGERKSAGGVAIQVLHVWLPPNHAHQAVDVRVTPG